MEERLHESFLELSKPDVSVEAPTLVNFALQHPLVVIHCALQKKTGHPFRVARFACERPEDELI